MCRRIASQSEPLNGRTVDACVDTTRSKRCQPEHAGVGCATLRVNGKTPRARVWPSIHHRWRHTNLWVGPAMDASGVARTARNGRTHLFASFKVEDDGQG